MRNIFFVALACFFSSAISAQISPNGNSGSSPTAYTNGTPNDMVYIWCSDILSTNQGSLTATPTNGVGPFTFNWFFHDQTTSSWTSLTSQSGLTSTLNNLASDGYRVEIRDAGNNVVDCFVAWVWNLNTEVIASNNVTGCNQANLSSTVNTTGSFSYFNPPPPESIITPSTQIQVCFSATHTWISDLAFYLVGPPSCGSPVILLSPNPGANGQGSVCNSGDNVSNLCFINQPAANFDPCAAPAPYSGLYSTYGPTVTPINWSTLNGCNAASGGWRVQIYDCIGADVGSLTNSTLTFSNLASLCGSPTTITYNSGFINSAINDNSCSAGTASIFQVPVNGGLTTPIVMTATTNLLWTANPAMGITNATNGNATASGVPTGTTDFILTATTTFANANCSSDDTTAVSVVLPIVDAGQNQSACGGASVTLAGSGAQTYSWDNGVSNGVSFVPGATTTYTVTGTASNGCQNTDQVTVTVAPVPVIDAGSPQAVCPGTSVVLAGSGGVSYTWNNGVADGIAFTPASTTTYTVTGTDASGCQNTDLVTVTVNVLPTVDAGIAQAICPNTAVTLSGSGAQTYSWDNGVTDGLSFTPVTTTTYTVTGTDANGCQNTDQVIISVNTVPTVGAGTDQTACSGQSVTLSGSGAQTYSWDNGVIDGSSFTPATTITYTVTGTDANGCQNTDQVTVTVSPNPTIDAGLAQSICQGASAVLSGSGGVTYTWNNGVSNGVSFTPASTATYTVTGTDAGGCQNTDQVTITVNTLPNVDAGLAQAICQNTATSLSGSGAQSYTWNNGVTNGVVFTPAATTTYTVTGTDANGCQNTDQVTITVNILPNVNAGVDQAVCNGLSLTLSGSGAQSYSWNNGVSNGISFIPGATTTYTVTGTDVNGCQDTDQITVTVNPLPTIGAGSDQEICFGTSVTLSGTGGVSYSWTNGVTNSNPFSPTVGSITYTVTGTDANGCQGTDQVVVTVVPVPVSVINSAGPLSGYPGLSVTFTNNSQFATTYEYDFDNGSIQNTTNVADNGSSTFNSPGIYTIVLTADNGICSDTSSIQVVIIPFEPLVVEIPNVFTPDGDNVNDLFYLNIENGASVDVIIVNRWGNPIHELHELTDKWDGTSKGDPVSNGVYFFTYTVTGKDGTTQAGQSFVEVVRK